MFSPTFVPSSGAYVFYPIGNTPAVNLLSHHAPQEGNDVPTEILMLACGDPRSILYSLWSEGRPGSEKFTFTCCDLEPAVLARNVLLLSLMLDHADANSKNAPNDLDDQLAAIWNLWYHFCIPKTQLDLLQDQAQKLLSYTETPEAWINCPYSTTIKFVSLQTVDELRKIWTRYSVRRTPSDRAKIDKARRREIKAVYDERYAGSGKSFTFYAGPHWVRGIEIMNKGLRGYWLKGVVGGNSSDLTALGPDKKGVINPLFTISGISNEFIVHFTSDPIATFHLASVFDGDVSNHDQTVEAMATLAKSQFREWSQAFVEYAKSGSVTVKLYYGDAVTFCHELSARNPALPTTAAIMRTYTSQWSPKPLLLGGDGAANLPFFFDVIDTSNVSDWVGMLNILIPTAQILARKSTSVLYTEIFRLSSREIHNELSEQLFMDVDLASLLIGLVPMGFVLGYTLENSCGEDWCSLDDPNGANRYRMRIPWRVVADQHTENQAVEAEVDSRVQFDLEELTGILFDIYLKIFAQEDLSGWMKKVRSQPGGRPMNSQVFSRYSRISFAMLLQHATRNILAKHWTTVFTTLAQMIQDDNKLDIGKDCQREHALQTGISGAMQAGATKPNDPNYPAMWKCVTLVVPRKELKVIERIGGAPGIHLVITRGKENNLFFSIHCFFGKVKQKNDGSWDEVVEDPSGWSGSSDLIVTAVVPYNIVDKKFDVGLLVTVDIHSMRYMEELGAEMCVYMTESHDKKHIILSDGPPGVPKERLVPHPSEYVVAHPRDQPMPTVVITATMSKGPLMLQAKYTITPGSDEAIALRNAAFVTFSDHSPCTVLLNIGDKHSRRVIFPYPVDFTKIKTKIARKSLWIEMNVPAASALVTGGYDIGPFPVIINENSQPSTWALPRFDLEKQPAILDMDPGTWLAESFDQIASVREKDIINKGSKLRDFRSTLPLFKKTLNQISMNVVDVDDPNVFCFLRKGADPPIFNTIIVAKCLRHARESGAILLDAWVIPLTLANRMAVAQVIATKTGKAEIFELSQDELKIWKHMFPAAVESCRRNWKHKPSCEYLKARKVPLSTEDFESPICGCGEGQDVDAFPAIPFVARLKSMATRVAIPTLTGVSYVEPMNPLIETEFRDD
ncbi:uncharacterized protein PAC_05581 [Phialocephala subalpina]|uniref:DUF4470 domain-containing protein n=1 Tax=Phialocephala subalpina TaxID=576137 RepID=A0A1L7WSH0_9HELO|nr:uncharacterized protein PAC_05581 [Phialocephala subalpina]